MFSRALRHQLSLRSIATALVVAVCTHAASAQAQFEKLTPTPPPKTDGVGVTPANFATIRDQLLRETWGERASGPDAWPMVVELINLQGPIFDELQKPAVPGGTRAAIEFGLVSNPPATIEDAAQHDAERARVLDAIARCEKAGVFAAQAALRDKFNIRWPDGAGDLSDWTQPIISGVGTMARMNAARMRLAADAKDWPAFIAACQDNLALARVASSNPLFIFQILGHATTQMGHRELRRATLAVPPDAATLRRLIAIIDDQRSIPNVTHMIRAERAYAVDTTEANHRWWGRASAVRKYEQLYDGIAALAAVPRWERTPEVFDLEGFKKAKFETSPGVPNNADGAAVILSEYDEAVCTLQGTRLLGAILAFEAEKGEPPASLSDLVPGILAEIPGDPWSKTGFVYRRIDAPSPSGRRFILYGVAGDGIDNGGVMSKDPSKWPFSDGGAGTDVVFSERD